MVSVIDMKEIATRKGGMILDATKVSAIDIKEIATRASSGGTITLRNASQLSPIDAKEIATRGQGHVVLDFT